MPGAVNFHQTLELLVVLRHVGPRTHHAHIPLKHIDKLGKLIQAGFPHKLAEGEDAGVSLARLPGLLFGLIRFFRLEVHAAEFEN